MTREIVIDTETTGLNPLTGDRVVEIGGVELINHVPTGRHFHKYINPERAMASDAYSVHGLSDEFLRDKPRFAEIADEMLAFFDGATLIAHNAPFDVQFLNFELEKCGRPSLNHTIIDTVTVAREMARLGFGTQGLARMQVLDLVGQKTEIRFEAWKRNQAFAAGTFQFKPGEDVDVVGQ